MRKSITPSNSPFQGESMSYNDRLILYFSAAALEENGVSPGAVHAAGFFHVADFPEAAMKM